MAWQRDLESPDPARQEAAKARMDALGLRLKATTAPTLTSSVRPSTLSSPRSLALTPRGCGRATTTWVATRVKAALSKKRHLALRQAHTRFPSPQSGARVAVAYAHAVATRRGWERERETAIEHAHEELLNEAARSPSLSSRLFGTFRTTRGARQQADGCTNPFLDPLPTTACWRGMTPTTFQHGTRSWPPRT